MKSKSLIIADASSYISKPSRSVIHRLYHITNKAWTGFIYKFRLIPSVNRLKKDESKDVLVISLDEDSRKILHMADIEVQTPQRYTDKESSQRIDEETMSFVRGFSKADGNFLFKNSSSYNGISLWSMTELEIWDYFVKINRTINLIERIIETEKPDEIIILDPSGFNGQIIRKIGESKGVPVTELLPRNIIVIKHFFTQKFLRVFLRRIGHKNLSPLRAKRYPGQSKDKNKILIGYFGRFISMYVPIIQELKKNEKNEIVVVGIGGLIGSEAPIESSKNEFLKTGVTFRYFEDYLCKNRRDKITGAIKSLDTKFSELKMDNTFKNNLSYKNIPLWDMVKNKLLFLYTVRFPKIIEYIEIMDNMIDSEAPDVILLGDDRSPFGKTFVEVASQKKVSTINIQPGIATEHPIYGETKADKTVVSGDYMKSVFVKRGVKEDDIFVTGQPRYDDLLRMSKDITREQVCRELDIPDEGIVLFAPTHSSEPYFEGIVRGIYNAMKKISDKQLVIKLHPGDSAKICSELAEELDIKIKISEGHLFELLCCCDVLITTYSTVGLEAMIVDKPVITINLTNKPDPYPYAESGAAMGVYKSEDIAPAIKKALYDPQVKKVLEANRKKFVYEHAYKMDGLASRRVADLIEKMIEEK